MLDKKADQAGAAVGGEESWRDRLLPHLASDWTRVFSILSEESWPSHQSACTVRELWTMPAIYSLSATDGTNIEDRCKEISPDNIGEVMLVDTVYCVARFAEEILRAKKIDLENTE